MKESIKDIHDEIKDKIHNFKRMYNRKPEFLLLNLNLWFDIQMESQDIIPPEYIMKPDGFWYIYGLKIAMLDGSDLQERHLKVA